MGASNDVNTGLVGGAGVNGGDKEGEADSGADGESGTAVGVNTTVPDAIGTVDATGFGVIAL